MKRVLLIVLMVFVMVMSALANDSTYLNFTAVNGPATIQLSSGTSSYPVSLQYSTDSVTWNAYTLGSIINLASGQKVYFKADSTNGAFNTHQFYMTGTVAADGNIMSLLDATMTMDSVPNYAFYRLFDQCNSLVNSPALPATTLADHCYSNMFDSCTSLTQAPALPATTLADYCYSWMFSHCTSLTQTPALPATTLADHCYDVMFYCCTSLMQAAALPATTLANWCYAGMYNGCTSLTQAPALPATTLTIRCYNSMFQSCTSLTQTPQLPATTLADFCYAWMFGYCSSLRQISTLPADTLDDFCYYKMFWGCDSLIVNVQDPGAQWIIPANNTVSQSIDNMFYGTGGTMNGTPSLNTIYYLPNGKITSDLLVNANANNTAMGKVTGGGYYDAGDSVIIVAKPNSHCHLVNWSNGATNDTIMLVVSGDTTLTANFAIDQHTVTAISNDLNQGYVLGGGVFNWDTTITLTAIPNENYHFVNWSNGDTTSSIQIHVNCDTSLTAYFAINQHTLTIIINDTVMGVVTGGGIYNHGETATLTAIPKTNYHFVSWSTGQTTSAITIPVDDDITMTAIFAPDIFNVSALPNYSNRGTVAGSGQYNYLDTATLTATPNEGYVFSGWDNGETNRVIYVTVESDTVITAIFTPDGTGVESTEETEYIVYSNHYDIIVNGTAGKMVRVYDLNGRLVSEVKEASDTQVFSVNVAGVYIVRIDDKKSIRVVVK